MKPLTNETIKDLPENTPITVSWSGWGNRKAKYSLHWVDSTPWARYTHPYKAMETDVAPLSNIGSKPCETKVWIDID